MRQIYLAGPDVFFPDASERGRAMQEICTVYGFVGVFPLDLSIPNFAHDRATGLAISAGNENLIAACDAVIANITPFRGPHADVGTAYEMGFARALGKIVCAYSASSRLLGERVLNLGGVDLRGCTVEPFGMVDNLMLEGGVEHSEGVIKFSFEDCVRHLARLWQ